MATRARLFMLVLLSLSVHIAYSRVLPLQGSRPRYAVEQFAPAFYNRDNGQATATAVATADGSDVEAQSWSSSAIQNARQTSPSMAPVANFFGGNSQQLLAAVQPSSTPTPSRDQSSLTPSQATDQTSQPQGSTAGSAVDNSVLQSVLDQHNGLRSRHGAPALSWSTQLQFSAQQWADNCNFQHSNGGDGENLAMGHASFEDAVLAWYDEVQQYDWNNPGYSESTGHFTQMVWRATTTLGCGWNEGCKLYVCRYSPAGNVLGQFEENVAPVVANS